MKLSYVIYCLYIGATTVAGAWPTFPDLPFHFQQLSGFLQNIMSNSLIPTFILDTNHPWLPENRGWLESYPDVASALCDKSSPLWTNPSPGHEIPTDLFSRIDIDNNKAGINRLGWDNAVSRLSELRNCTAAREDVRHLHVYISVHTGQYSSLVDSEMPSELPGLFAEVLASMPHLERLDWGLNADHTVAFRDEFLRRNLTLPSVRHLVPGAQSHYLLPMCPGLETLEAGSFFHHASWNEGYRGGRDSRSDLVRAASAVNSLKEFLMLGGWSCKRLEEVLDAMPNLVKLTIQGTLDPDSEWYQGMGSKEEKTIEEGQLFKKYLSIISRFPRLEQLHLPSAPDLYLGFDGGPWCGNAYDGEDGRRYGRSVVKEGIDTTELASDIVMKAVPHLKALSIGDDQANFTRNENGDLEIVWPWTGRKEEYAYEIFPQ